MIAKVYSAIPQGYEGNLIEVEGDTSRSLPAFHIVGMANKTITEARERVRSAIVNSGFRFPDQRVTVNLAPAELTKDGTHLDLPIALTILVLSQQLLPEDVHDKLFVGELSLNGQTKPIRGIINIVETAFTAGFKEIYIPEANLSQAALVPEAHLIGVDSLKSLFLHLKGTRPLPVYKNRQVNTNFSTQTPSTSVPASVVKNTYSEVSNLSKLSVVNITNTGVISAIPHSLANVVKNNQTDITVATTPVVKNTKIDSHPSYFLDHIRGQALAKRALIIAIAGAHNILLSGPPGSGKTLLAKVAQNLLPPPSPLEQIEITKIHNLTQATLSTHQKRPFRAPHHTSSATAIIGGGPSALPGEISLAHRGILFLDELPEYTRPVLESLRQPLEDHQITITRVNQHATYPANFILIATMNPCPCGYLDDPDHTCTCQPYQIANYQKRLSGPILDRIDLTLQVKKLPSHELTINVVKNTQTDTEHRTAELQIQQARLRQNQRYHSSEKFNSDLTSLEISQYLHLSPPAERLLQTAAKKLDLSARGYFKIIKVAQTIADLADSNTILPEHIAEALTFRQRPFISHL